MGRAITFHVPIHIHTGQELSWYFLNCVKGSEGTQLTTATLGTTPKEQSNPLFQIFSHFFEPKKSIILVFGGHNKLFWTPIPFLASKLMVLGGSDFSELLI